MTFIEDAILKLSDQLYPSGRAFAMPMPDNTSLIFITEDGLTIITEDGLNDFITENGNDEGGILYRLHRALGKSEERLYTDAVSTYDSIFPDNPNFTEQDALDWQNRLGIYTNNTDLPMQMLAIIRKMNYPGSTAPRQSAVYLQQQLNAAGFTMLTVYENIFSDGMGGWVSQTPAEVLGISIGQAYYNNFDYGQLDYGAGYASAGITLVANHMNAADDADFVIEPDYKSTFFIAGATISTFANVPASRQAELRQLILTLKPLQTVAFLFINFI